MIWLVVLIVLVAIFGLGTLLEAAFWTLLVVAAVVVALAVLGARLFGR